MKTLTTKGNLILLALIAILGALVVSLIINPVFAQIAGDVMAEPSSVEIMAFLSALGGIKGAGALGIAAMAVQGLMLLFRSKLGSFAGKFKLLLVLLLSLVSGVIALKMHGVDLGAALLHSSTMASFQVFANQVYKQFFAKED